MRREDKFGYGFLLVGTAAPFLVDKLFGLTLAITFSVACLVIGTLFLWSGHRHKEEGTPRQRKLWVTLAYVCALSTLIALLSIAAIRVIPKTEHTATTEAIPKLPHVHVFKFVPHKPIASKPLMTNVHWRNDGNASGSVYGFGTVVIAESFPINSADEVKVEDELFSTMKVGVKMPGVPLPMLAGGDYWVTLTGPAPTKKQVAGFKAQTARAYVVGIFRYVEHPELGDVEFCVFWNRDQQAIFECKTHNKD